MLIEESLESVAFRTARECRVEDGSWIGHIPASNIPILATWMWIIWCPWQMPIISRRLGMGRGTEERIRQ